MTSRNRLLAAGAVIAAVSSTAHADLWLLGQELIIPFQSSSGPNDLGLFDIDGDGLPDAVVPFDDGSIVALLNNGDRTFREVTLHQDPARRYFHVDAGDFDGDGKKDDLVAVSQATPHSYDILMLESGATVLQVSSGLLTGGSTSGLVVGDLDRNGQDDIVLTSDLVSGAEVILNTAPPQQVQGSGAVFGGLGVTLGDGDGDGDLDVFVTTGRPNAVDVFENLNSGILNFAGNIPLDAGNTSVLPGGITAKDINGDGRAELAMIYNRLQDAQADLYVLWNLGNPGGGLIDQYSTPVTAATVAGFLVGAPAVNDIEKLTIVDPAGTPLFPFGDFTVAAIGAEPKVSHVRGYDFVNNRYDRLDPVPAGNGALDYGFADFDGDSWEDLALLDDVGESVVLNFTPPNTPLAQPYGSGNALTLATSGKPVLGTPNFQILATGAAPGSLGFLALSAGAASIPVAGGQTLLVTFPALFLPLVADAATQASLTGDLPGDAAVDGMDLYSWYVNFGAQPGDSPEATNGLRLRFGQVDPDA